MSGPALRQLHAHRAIHEGGLSGTVMKTRDMMEHLREGELETAYLAGDDLISHWKTRVISHEEAEKNGFYKDIADENPAVQEAITMLTRD